MISSLTTNMTSRTMFFRVVIVLAALGASACSYGSAVDIAPMKDRLAHPMVPPGDYCQAHGAQGAYIISTHDDCGKLTWNGAKRSFDVIDEDKPKDAMSLAVVALGGGLFVTQYDAGDPADRPDRHQLNLVIASGKAFAGVGVLDGDELGVVFKRHPNLKIGGPPGKDNYIAAGDVAEIKAFLRDAGAASLKAARVKGEEVEVVVLDKRSRAEHPASAAQVRDIEAVKAIAETLTPK
jgi:hypothetical protein